MAETESAGNRRGIARLKNKADAEGRAWAASCSEALRKDGRRAEGGWPGTLSGARARVVARLLVRPEPSALVTNGEIEQLAKLPMRQHVVIGCPRRRKIREPQERCR